jgi:hypothetical protein
LVNNEDLEQRKIERFKEQYKSSEISIMKKGVFKKIGGNLNSFNYFKHSRDCKKIGGCRSISRDKGIETSAFAKSGHHLFSYRKWMMPTTFFLTETT